MEEEDGGLRGALPGAGPEGRSCALEPDETMPVPGLARRRDRDGRRDEAVARRGSGGLAGDAQAPGGKERAWVVLGASRGEAGILGEGIRQALLRDPTYGPALTAACEMLAS